MAEITTTQAFSDGDTVTATKLNNITANAAIQTEAITNRSAETTVDQANDLLLMYDASATALKKVSLSNVIKAGTASNFPVTGNATIGGTLGVTGVISAASTLELGHASDTTLSRGAAGRLQVEGVDVPTISSTDTLTNKTLTSPAISGGTINNAVIGGTTAAAGSFTTLSATSPITTQAGTAAAPAIVPTGDTNTGVFFPAADTIAFSEGGTEAMRIDSSGRVGIGTSSPASLLELALARTDTAGSGALTLNGTQKYSFRCTNSTPSNGLAIDSFNGASWSTPLVIDNSGRVGIGTTSPLKELQINATEPTIRLEESGAGSKRLELSVNNAAEAKIFANQSGGTLIFGTVGTERLRITSGGLVLIGCTASPSSSVSGVLLQNPFNASNTFSLGSYTGSATVISFVNGNGTIGSISVNGSATAYNTSSDYRLKTNIEPISNGIDRIKQLPVYRFNWIANSSGNKVDGFVAHEAQAIVPECVTGEKDAVDADGKPIYQGIDQSKIVPLLTAALKEAIAKIETLETNNTALESRIAALEAA